MQVVNSHDEPELRCAVALSKKQQSHQSKQWKSIKQNGKPALATVPPKRLDGHVMAFAPVTREHHALIGASSHLSAVLLQDVRRRHGSAAHLTTAWGSHAEPGHCDYSLSQSRPHKTQKSNDIVFCRSLSRFTWFCNILANQRTAKPPKTYPLNREFCLLLICQCMMICDNCNKIVKTIDDMNSKYINTRNVNTITY